MKLFASFAAEVCAAAIKELACSAAARARAARRRRLRVTAGAETMTTQGVSLALLDGGQWYLLGLSDQEVLTNLRRTYPEFGGVALPVKQK